ncbi:TPA: helix-turn-helix domain-containing protein [Bacillus cereus]
MNKLISSLIHDKSVYRKIHILEMLIMEEESLTSKEMAKQLNCSNRTIINEISELKNDLPENWDIIGMKTRGYTLQKPPIESLTPIIKSYLQESMLYIILLDTLKNNDFTLEKWCLTLFTNKSTLKSNLKQYKSILSENRLKFSFSPMQLKGEEIHIRYFYQAFLFSIERYVQIITLPEELMRKVKKNLDFYNVEIDYFLLNVVMYVSIHRIASKNYVNKKIKSNIIFTPDQSTCFNNIISEIESYCMVKLSQNEKDVLNLFFFLFSNSMDQQKNDVIKYLEDNKRKDYKVFLELIDMIISNNDRQKIEPDHLKLELCIEFYKLYIAKQCNFSFEYFSTPPNYLSNRLQELYDSNFSIINKWNRTVNRNQFNEYEISRMAQIVTYILCSIYPKKNVLFIFEGDGVYEKLAFTTLKDNLGASVDIHRKPDDNMKYDLIITNCNVSNLTEIPTLFISRNFKQKDIEYINHLLFNF